MPKFKSKLENLWNEKVIQFKELLTNYENESIPTSSTLYWSEIGSGKRLNIDGRDIPNITYDQLKNKPTSRRNTL